ncbi:outer mitochondrial transmembrane helix translocase [Trichomonascus vanleenenianus]|uniref:protein-degrading AAA family ATPase MSP1 n=1 Tax=Trichomonascus vanleenenianus TaxID=2268995 RepID=UPI003EC9865E
MSKLKFDPRIITDIVFFLGAGASIYYLFSHLLQQVGGEPSSSKETKKKANASIQRLQADHPEIENLDEYEQIIISNVVTPAEIKVSFKDVGGLEGIIDELRESVLYPLTVPGLFTHHSSLLQAPKGVLLYGPPGCGKTMLAKALAAESSANFINIKMSTIMDKWYGESNKLVAAIFSLAQKLQPCIIFIDEIDSFLRERQSNDHEITSMLKAEFMTLWDGLTTEGRVMVLGATNRPNDIDSAILRRMPKRFAVPLPKMAERKKILEIMLRGAKLDEHFDIDYVAERTAGLSGSDIKEACRNAAMLAMREYIRENFVDGKHIRPDEKINVRPLRTTDFFVKQSSEENLPLNKIRELARDVE